MQNINHWRLWIWKTNSLINLINQQPDVDEIYLYAKYPCKEKSQLLIKKPANVATKHINDSN